MKRIITLTGRSCSGKTSIENELVKTHGFGKVISHTTRPPRSEEVNGTSYHFVSFKKYGDEHRKHKLVENVRHGIYRYGVHISSLEAAFESSSNGSVVIVCAPEGREQLRISAKRLGIDFHEVFVFAPTHDIHKRMTERLISEMVFAMEKGEYASARSALIQKHATRCALQENVEMHWLEEFLSREGQSGRTLVSNSGPSGVAGAAQTIVDEVIKRL